MLSWVVLRQSGEDVRVWRVPRTPLLEVFLPEHECLNMEAPRCLLACHSTKVQHGIL